MNQRAQLLAGLRRWGTIASITIVAVHRWELSSNGRVAVAGAFSYAVADDLTLRLTPITLVRSRWNFTGKIQELAVALIVGHQLRLFHLARKRGSAPRPAITALIAVFVAWHTLSWLRSGRRPRERPGLDVILFQGGLVGLAEEAAWRGVIQGLLERGIGRWRAALLTGSWFALVHVLDPSRPPDVTVKGQGLLRATTMLALSIFRAVTGGLLPSLILHNAVNGLHYIVLPYFARRPLPRG